MGTLDNGAVRCFSPLSKSSQDWSFRTPQPKKSTVPTNRSPPSDVDGSLRSSVKKGSPIKSSDRNQTTTVLSKADQPKKPANFKIEIAVPSPPSLKEIQEDNVGKSEAVPELKTRHVLFSKTREERAQRFGGSRSGSRVVPFDDDEKHVSGVIDGSAAEEAYDSQKDAEDLSLIREQLLQIENQQSSLLDLLQVCTVFVFLHVTKSLLSCIFNI